MSRSIVVAGLVLLAMGGCTRDWQAGQGKANDTAQAGSGSPPAAGIATTAPSGSQSLQPAGFAKAPDRGDLAAYPAKRQVRRDPDGVYTFHRVDISEAHALRAIVDGVMEFTTPSGERLRFQYERHVEHPGGDWTWIGRTVGGQAHEDAIVTFGAQAVFGRLTRSSGQVLELAMEQGVSWLVESDPVALAKRGPMFRHAGPDYLVPPAAGGKAALLPQAAMANAKAATPGSPAVIDLLVAYTTGFREGVGGQSIAMTRLNYLVDLTNEAFVNSRIHAQVRLRRAMEVDYPDTGSNSQALDDLTSVGVIRPFGGLKSGPADIGDVAAAMRNSGSDLVVLARKFNIEHESCGVAWVLGPGLDAIAGYADYGRSVVSDGSSLGPDGARYICGQQTLAHELGHNLGSMHDLATVEEQNGGALPESPYWAFPYSFGYRTAQGAGNFKTIMAYYEDRDSPVTETPYLVFSNPDITFCGGAPCGIPGQADNARSINQTAPVAAAFAVPRTVRGDIDGDGNADLLWRSDNRTRVAFWRMQGHERLGEADFGAAQQWSVMAPGDLDGNGREDLVWSDGTRMYLWANFDGAGFEVTRMRDVPAGWQVIGTADIDGDAKAELLWRSRDQTRFGYWVMEGPRYVRHWTTAVGPGWRMAGAGNLKWTAARQLVWTNGRRLVLWDFEPATGGFNALSLGAHPTGWDLVGVGDVRARLFWRSADNTRFGFWGMNGAERTAIAIFPVDPQWRLAAVGDLDGDGVYSEITWVTDTHVVAWNEVVSWDRDRRRYIYRYDEQPVGRNPGGWTLLP